MTATAEAPTLEAPTRKGDTPLKNVRVPPPLWDEVGIACQRLKAEHDIVTDRSKIARDAYEATVANLSDPDWLALAALAKERNTTVEELQRIAVSQYLGKVKRDRRRRTRST